MSFIAPYSPPDEHSTGQSALKMTRPGGAFARPGAGSADSDVLGGVTGPPRTADRKRNVLRKTRTESRSVYLFDSCLHPRPSFTDFCELSSTGCCQSANASENARSSDVPFARFVRSDILDQKARHLFLPTIRPSLRDRRRPHPFSRHRLLIRFFLERRIQLGQHLPPSLASAHEQQDQKAPSCAPTGRLARTHPSSSSQGRFCLSRLESSSSSGLHPRRADRPGAAASPCP